MTQILNSQFYKDKSVFIRQRNNHSKVFLWKMTNNIVLQDVPQSLLKHFCYLCSNGNLVSTVSGFTGENALKARQKNFSLAIRNNFLLPATATCWSTTWITWTDRNGLLDTENITFTLNTTLELTLSYKMRQQR